MYLCMSVLYFMNLLWKFQPLNILSADDFILFSCLGSNISAILCRYWLFIFWSKYNFININKSIGVENILWYRVDIYWHNLIGQTDRLDLHYQTCSMTIPRNKSNISCLQKLFWGVTISVWISKLGTLIILIVSVKLNVSLSTHSSALNRGCCNDDQLLRHGLFPTPPLFVFIRI